MNTRPDQVRSIAERLLHGEVVLHVAEHIEPMLAELEGILGKPPKAQKVPARRYEKGMGRTDIAGTVAGTRRKHEAVWRLRLE